MKYPTILATCVIAIGLVAQTRAASMSLEIQFLGLNLAYDGTHIYDATDPNGGNGNPAEADPLTSMKFLVDGATVGILTTNIWADISIPVANIPVGGGVVMTSVGDNFGFDLLTSAVNGWGLALDLDDFSVFYTGSEIAIAGGGLASNINSQNLPFDLEISEFDDIKIAFSSANVSNVTDDSTYLTGFNASGTGNVKGVLVPEPASVTMLLVAGLGLVGIGRRRNATDLPDVA